jgi:hypothetical protein
MEIWKAIPDHEGRYEVSDLGRIRSVERTANYGRWGAGGIRNRKSNIRALSPTGPGGYLACNVNVPGGKTVCLKAHLSVLKAFIGPCPSGMEGCHDDGKTGNNRLDNLRWDTKSNNNQDKNAHGTAQKGSRNGASKLTEAQVSDIKRRIPNETLGALASAFGVSITTIWFIKTGKKWAHVLALT